MYHEKRLSLTLADNSECPLCDTSAYSGKDPTTNVLTIVCPTCGRFHLSGDTAGMLMDLKQKRRQELYKLSHEFRKMSERVVGKSKILTFPTYSSNDILKILDYSNPSVQEKLNALLRYLGSASEFPGDSAVFDCTNDYAVIGAKNSQEAGFFLESLAEQELVLLHQPYTLTTETPAKISAKGWIELDRIAQSGNESFNTFIAMWFDPSRDESEKAISDAILDAGYNPIRIDRLEHLNKIDDEIIAQIRQSRFLVADFTGQRNGVYFEAGFMLGLGRPVIWVCDRADLANVHFDTRQYNTIDYTDADSLKKRLQLRIVANLGKGAYKQ